MTSQPLPLITIDGPSATGKSSVAWHVANQLKLNFLNSGSLYRIAAYYVVYKGFQSDDIETLSKYLNQDQILFEPNIDHDTFTISINGDDIASKLQSETIGQMASMLSKSELLRRSLVIKQQSYYQTPGLVADGRDMGSCIFPDAHFKFFLTANSKVRAERRVLQLHNQKINANFTEVHDALVKRDEQDATRSIAPLVIPAKAVVIDTTQMQLSEVINKVIDHCVQDERCQ
jgi:cytidylate kinase|tara:strand:+ start:3814 stop:4506 length:693 start_codon:yes stop_codon:yes gene_type:complete